MRRVVLTGAHRDVSFPLDCIVHITKAEWVWYTTGIMNTTNDKSEIGASSEEVFRVGILTYLTQLNYGGVLQAFALQDVLQRLGAHVKVIDYWLVPNNALLRGLFAGPLVGALASWCAGVILACGRWMDTIRRVRTVRFIRGQLSLTDYHFVTWKEMEGKDLGLDCLVVGSDQVWGPGWAPYHKKDFFFVDAPKDIPAISYAASFGTLCAQDKLEPHYGALLDRFSAISVREAKGVQLVASVGHQATHVLDPTQLLSATRWREVLALPERRKKPVLVCYFMCQYCSDWLLARLAALRTFAKRMGYRVEILVNDSVSTVPHSPKELLRHERRTIRYWWESRGLRVLHGAGPREFMKAFAGATCVLSNSFHALQFASIFGLNARIIRSSEKDRSAMFERFTDFQAKYVQGPLFADDVGDALASLERGETISYDEAALAADRERSLTWLREALAKATGEAAND